jgi:hypothetical protein
MGGDRPRGHTSLTGAVDAQLAVKRDNAGIITVKVEWLKAGQEGAEIVSRLEQVELGADSYGDPIVSYRATKPCVFLPPARFQRRAMPD